MSQKLLTRAEVAELMSISVRSVDRLRKEGALQAIKVLTTVRFREEDVRRAIAALEQGRGRQTFPA